MVMTHINVHAKKLLAAVKNIPVRTTFTTILNLVLDRYRWFKSETGNKWTDGQD